MELEYEYLNPSFKYRFPLDSPLLILKALEDHGWVVVSGVATEDQCKEIISLQWNYLESLGTGLEKDSPKTWYESKRWPDGALSGQILAPYVGHCKAVWKARQLVNVKEIFSLVYSTTKLQVAYDTMNILRPYVNETVRPKPLYPHLDQHPDHYPTCGSYQGFLNLIRSDTEDGGIQFLDSGHKLCRGYLSKNAKPNRFLPATKRRKLLKIMIEPNLRPGDFVLWDSRVVHGVAPPLKSTTQPQDTKHFRRSIIYISMTPRAQISKENQRKAELWFKHGKTTCHDMSFPKLKPLREYRAKARTDYTNKHSIPILTDWSLVEPSDD